MKGYTALLQLAQDIAKNFNKLMVEYGMSAEELVNLDFWKQFDPALNPDNWSMKKSGCAALVYLAAVAQWKTGQKPAATQILDAITELNKAGYMEGLNVINAKEVMKKGLSMLGSDVDITLSQFYTSWLELVRAEGVPDITVKVGENPRTGSPLHYQLGDWSGRTIGDPGYTSPINLINPQWRGIYFNE
jgi:hypothetical protein